MARTGMIARGLRASRRMSRGSVSTVYVLAKASGADTHTSVASTEDAHVVRNEDGTAVLRLTEDSLLTVSTLRRAAAFAISSGASGFKVWRKTGEATPAYGQAARDWSFQIAPTGVTFTIGVPRLLEDGTARLLETGAARRLDS